MGFLRQVGAASLFALTTLGSAAAQPATRGLTPIPFNAASPAALSVTLDPAEARIGDTVSICFESSREGFVSLWDISTEGQVARVYPNQFTKMDAAAPIQGKRRYCAGASNDPFRFRVDGPPGIEDLYLLWTTRPELQPTGTSYRDAQALVDDLQRLGAASPSEWGSQKLTYDVVPGATASAAPVAAPPIASPPASPPPEPARQAPVPPRPPTGEQEAANAAPVPPQNAPAVYVFAMGANVGKLTKSNQDAQQFTRAAADVFSIPKSNIRLVTNGTRADFIQGMQWLRTVATPRDYVFIYFSGHGGRFRSDSSDDGWDEFLVPYDFQAPNPDPKNFLFAQTIDVLINRLQTRNVLTVTDACHGGGVYRSMDASVLGARSKYFAIPPDMLQAARAAAADVPEDAADAPRTRAAGGRGRVKANGLLLAAAGREQEALEGSKGSFFTLALIEQMVGKEGGTMMDVFRRSVRDTAEMTGNRQEPVAVGDANLGRSIRIN